MSSPLRLLFGIVALVASTCVGCSWPGLHPQTITYQAQVHGQHRARDPDTVAIYSASLPTFPYYVVGHIHAQQGVGDVDPGSRLLIAMRGEAAARGCDAVVLEGQRCEEDADPYPLAYQGATLSALDGDCVVRSQ